MNDRTITTSAGDSRSINNKYNNSYGIHLRISEQPPLYAFLGEWFEIAVSCEVENDWLIAGEGPKEDLSATSPLVTLRASLQATNDDIISKSCDDTNPKFQLVRISISIESRDFGVMQPCFSKF